MFANLDLQLNSIDFSDDLVNTAPADAGGQGGGSTDFANVLRGRVDTSLENAELDGGFLPPNGNSLPLTLEPVELALPVIPAPNVSNATATASLDHEGAAATENDDSARRLGLQHEVLFDGQRSLADRGSVPAIVVGSGGRQDVPPLRVPGTDKGLPRVFVPPTAELAPPPRKGGPRVFVPPSGAHRVDIPTTVSTQIPVLDGHQATPASFDLPVVHRAPKVHAAPKRSDSLPKNVEAAKYAPVANGAITSAGIEAAAIRDSARLSVSRLHHIQSGGHGQATAQAPPPAAAMAAPGSPAFAAEMELAAELINTPVRDAQWADRLSERLVMLAGGQQRIAEIRLTPAELGPLRVQISIEDGATNVAIQAHHAVTRDALEQALPRLRELLEENGLTLGDASVSEQDVNERRGETKGDAQGNSAPGESKDAAGDDSELSASRLHRVADGWVDTFA